MFHDALSPGAKYAGIGAFSIPLGGTGSSCIKWRRLNGGPTRHPIPVTRNGRSPTLVSLILKKPGEIGWPGPNFTMMLAHSRPLGLPALKESQRDMITAASVPSAAIQPAKLLMNSHWP